jgi:hypothetical protein
VIRYRTNVAPLASTAAPPAADAINAPKVAEANDDRRPLTATERKRLSRERRRQGVRFMITIPVTDDALDAWVDDCGMSLEESHDRKRVTEFVEDLVNSPGRRVR